MCNVEKSRVVRVVEGALGGASIPRSKPLVTTDVATNLIDNKYLIVVLKSAHTPCCIGSRDREKSLKGVRERSVGY